MSGSWEDCLFRLHSKGWNADDIDEACEALDASCSKGPLEGTPVEELTPEQARSVLGTDVEREVLVALQRIAAFRSRQDADAAGLHRALYDLDAFADKLTNDE